MNRAEHPAGRFGDLDQFLFAEGTHRRVQEKLGAHVVTEGGQRGVRFSVWAPRAETIDVIGDWNDWTPGRLALRRTPTSGIWEGFGADVGVGCRYKLRIRPRDGGVAVDKADPYAFATEAPPGTASVVAAPEHAWGDAVWMGARRACQAPGAPLSIYEVDLGSWMRDPARPERPLTYRDLAPRLVEHVQRTGFTHVELLPVAEHPRGGAAAYDVTAFFAPTARHGPPEDFMAFVDALHRGGIGVIVDWTPDRLAEDEHGLVRFDGAPLYERVDGHVGFDHARGEVRSFLISSALFWLERFHVDGLRVVGAASMGRRDGDGAIALLRALNTAVADEHPGALTIADDALAWPRVTGVPADGDLGFSLAWDVNAARDALALCAGEPRLRPRLSALASERLVLPLSHAQVEARSLLEQLPGDDWQKFARLRLLYAFLWGQPGGTLLFAGDELGQRAGWHPDRSLDWHLLREFPLHAQVQLLVSELNRLMRAERALHELDTLAGGVAWLTDEGATGVSAFLRRGGSGARPVLAVFNATPAPRFNARVGAPQEGLWAELLNTDGAGFGGSNHGNFGVAEATPVPAHGQSFSLNLTLPPLGALYLAPYA